MVFTKRQFIYSEININYLHSKIIVFISEDTLADILETF